ncbi:MAG: hypothetical protein GWO19_03470 [Nitrospinaceae bacterium]|nr:hypothetical protein [Nitrospinaceae bacterium]NIU97469.1 hypothetical protein [Nitrospinaceae bacterium]
MTLEDLGQVTGIPLQEIVRGLELPADTPADAKLGRLGQRHGFKIDDVREWVRHYSP